MCIRDRAKVGRITSSNSAAIRTNGTLWCWGDAETGCLGLNSQTDYSSPKQVPGTNWDNVMLDRQRYNGMGTKTDGTIWTWGSSGNGVLGINDGGSQYSSPKQVPGTTWNTEEFIMTDSNVHILKTDGTLWGWGYNNRGELGQNNRTAYSSPIQIGTDTDWTQVGGNRGNFLMGKDTPSKI